MGRTLLRHDQRPSFRLTDGKRPEMISSVVRTAVRISEELLRTDY
jgi:hypothetical protein